MTLQQLRYFLSVADSLSFTKTAKENYVSQTAVTRQIQVLEQELGAALFARSTAHVRLTATGAHFCKACQEIVRIWESAADEARQIARSHTIALALPTAVEQEVAVGPVREFRARHPEVAFSFTGGVRQELINDLVESKIDLLISLALDLPDLGGLQTISLPPGPRGADDELPASPGKVPAGVPRPAGRGNPDRIPFQQRCAHPGEDGGILSKTGPWQKPGGLYRLLFQCGYDGGNRDRGGHRPLQSEKPAFCGALLCRAGRPLAADGVCSPVHAGQSQPLRPGIFCLPVRVSKGRGTRGRGGCRRCAPRQGKVKQARRVPPGR